MNETFRQALREADERRESIFVRMGEVEKEGAMWWYLYGISSGLGWLAVRIWRAMREDDEEIDSDSGSSS